MTEAISVSALNQYIKTMMDRDALLSGVLVRGEISNYKAYPSGHHYFSLKDAEGTIRCVLFRREAAGLRFRLENGMKVVAAGRITVFPRDGQYQLYCSQMLADGMGDLHLAFAQTKERLEKEGLFAQEHKKPIPRCPERIALITSPAGAAVRDMIRVLGDRYPLAKVLLVPVLVQGEKAPGEIAAALQLVNRQKAADVIITGRGGGSIEDLWAFNDERVARAIFASKIPVISAVGHEPDVTIADYVADVRGATPSNAAELSVPDQKDLRRGLLNMELRMAGALRRKVIEGRRIFERAKESHWLKVPFPLIQEKRQLLDHQQQRMALSLERSVAQEKKRLAALAASLDALSPLKVLGRGYSIVQREDGHVVYDQSQVSIGDGLQVRLGQGSLACRVERKEP